MTFRLELNHAPTEGKIRETMRIRKQSPLIELLAALDNEEKPVSNRFIDVVSNETILNLDVIWYSQNTRKDDKWGLINHS